MSFINTSSKSKEVSLLKTYGTREAWVAQLVKCRTLDFSSGLDLRVLVSSPALGYTLSVKPTLKKNKNQAMVEFKKQNKRAKGI